MVGVGQRPPHLKLEVYTMTAHYTMRMRHGSTCGVRVWRDEDGRRGTAGGNWTKGTGY